MRNFVFRAEDHTYWLDGLRIPSYSAVSKEEGFSDYRGVPESVMEASRKFGKAGHKMILLYNKGILDERALDINLMPYLNGYKKFLSDFSVDLLHKWSEYPICSFLWRYGVTPDAVGMARNKLSVIEWKFTSALLPVVGIQTAAQAVAIEENSDLKIKQRIGVRIYPDGYEAVFFKEKSDQSVWFSGLNCFTWRKRHKLIREE